MIWGYFRRLRDNFGCGFLQVLVATYFGVKGLMTSLVALCALPLFLTEYKVNLRQYNAFSVCIMTPWSLKPLIGILSDRVPLWGKHKVPYILISSCVGIGATIGLALAQTALLSAFLMTLVSLHAATTDLLTEGKYAELMQLRPTTGSDLTSFVSSMFFVSGLLAAVAVGPLADAGHVRALFWVAMVPAGAAVYPILRGHFPDQLSLGTSDSTWFTVLSWVMATAAIGLTIITMAVDPAKVAPKLVYTLCASLVLIAVSFRALPRGIAKANLYLFLTSAAYVSIEGALDYFYTAPSDCFEDGPHFTMKYYVTLSTVVSAIAGLASIVVFQTFLSDWSYRHLFIMTTVMRVVAALVDLIIVLRWNRTVLGVSDHITYMFGNSIVRSIVSELEYIPAVVLTSKLCPKHHEATVYAILAGFQNFGHAVGSSTGASMTALFGVNANFDKNQCHFDRLPELILMAHLALPLLVIPTVFLLIPLGSLRDSL